MPEDVMRAFNESDIMVHGSGPSVVGEKRLRAWVKTTGKPFGIFWDNYTGYQL